MSARVFRSVLSKTLVVVAVMLVLGGEKLTVCAAEGWWQENSPYGPSPGMVRTGAGAQQPVLPSGWMAGNSASPSVPTQTAGQASCGIGTIPSSALASAAGVSECSTTSTPNMIGDSLNNGFGGMRFFGAGILSPVIGVNGATIGISGGDRRFKMAQDEHPIPTDRIFFNYNHFQNPVMDYSGTRRNLDRYTFGIEKTFLDNKWSFGFRVPFASGYNSTQSIEPGAGLAATEFGDMSLVLKRILINRDRLAVSAGLSTVFPSGDDFRITDNTGTLVEIWNESIHLGPFVGMVFAPTDRLFFLGFGQIDFDTQGSTVLMRDANGTPGSLATRGVFNDQTRAFLDFSVGYRLYQNPYANILTAVTPMFEVHYTSTLTDMDYVAGPLGQIGATALGGTGRRDIVNLTGGLHFQFGELTSMTFAGVVPVTNASNREFDSEILVQFNRRF